MCACALTDTSHVDVLYSIEMADGSESSDGLVSKAKGSKSVVWSYFGF